MTNTTRLGLTYPAVVGSSLADVPTDMQTFLNQLDAIAAVYSSGLFSARPAASAVAGKTYWATDYKRSYWSDGTTWYDIQPPVGQIIAFPSSTPPDATWLPCDGASLLRATYPALFGLIGTVYGSVDGTHFNVPDLRGRTIFGVDGGAGRIVTAPHTIATSGGSERITLSSAESGQKAVSTGIESVTHLHAVLGTTGTAGGFNLPIVQGSVANNFNGTTDTENANHTHSITGSAASSSHENLPPFLTLAWHIKA